MIVNRGHWDELPEQCKRCANIQIMSLHMDGNHYYQCGKYPLADSNKTCPKFTKNDEK